MPQKEISGKRDLTYSVWHRRESTRRFIGMENAQLLAMIDLDVCLWIEYDDGTKEPIALIEMAEDVGQSNKTSTVTLNLAKRARLPCLVVLYKKSKIPNPVSSEYQDILSFRVKRLHPDKESNWREMTPKEYAEYLLRMRRWKTIQINGEYFKRKEEKGGG